MPVMLNLALYTAAKLTKLWNTAGIRSAPCSVNYPGASSDLMSGSAVSPLASRGPVIFICSGLGCSRTVRAYSDIVASYWNKYLTMSGLYLYFAGRE